MRTRKLSGKQVHGSVPNWREVKRGKERRIWIEAY